MRIVEDVSPADWLAIRVTGRPGTVVGTVPSGYEAYARLLHPVEFHDGRREPTTWARVAEITGRHVHPTVQWHSLIGTTDPWGRSAPGWPDGQPEQGNLALAPLQTLCDALAPHTTTPEDCYFALWSGWGQLTGGRAWVRMTPDGSGDGVEPPPLLTARERAAPQVHLPGRDYHLFHGPLSAAAALARYGGPDQVWPTQSPNLIWPADHAWCVGTEIDLDSTLVGGTTGMIEAVLASPWLEARSIDGGASLQADADRVNI
nr:hypothetical protein DA06_05000 [Georgenia sp. SUBG003]